MLGARRRRHTLLTPSHSPGTTTRRVSTEHCISRAHVVPAADASTRHHIADWGIARRSIIAAGTWRPVLETSSKIAFARNRHARRIPSSSWQRQNLSQNRADAQEGWGMVPLPLDPSPQP